MNLPLSLFFSLKNSKDAPIEVTVMLVKRQMIGEKLEYHARGKRFPAELDRLLAQTYPAGDEQLAEDGRRAPRQRSSFQVTSRELPGYKALTSNLSTSGIQLIVREEIAPGKLLSLFMDFDDFRLQNITCQGRISGAARISASLPWASSSSTCRSSRRDHPPVPGDRRRAQGCEDVALQTDRWWCRW